MATAKQPTASGITADEFNALLQEYASLLEAISLAKGARDGQESLKELDQFRYDDAPRLFALDGPGRAMEADDVNRLVQWKLRHGTFRPSLMKLVSSNDAKLVKQTVQEGIAVYKKKADVSAALAILTKLKGIGPATASLLLAVHAPSEVVFFADEAFYWLCGGGKVVPLKYTVKEYAELQAAAVKLAKRLGVKAIDTERVAFAVMKREGSGPQRADASAPSPKESSGSVAVPERQAVKREASGREKEGPASRETGADSRRPKRPRKA